jgi:hypothetical protein
METKAVVEAVEAAQKMNPRFIAYAKSEGLAPAAVLSLDAERFPGGKMTGFMLWIQGRWAAWRRLNGLARYEQLSEADHAAFDAWLEAT